MKRSTHTQADKDSDILRLRCLTKDNFDDIWPYDGNAKPEHVCGYMLGVYYELDSTNRAARIDYFVKGNIDSSLDIHFPVGGDIEWHRRD